jgi:hypothetical protein
VSVVRLNQEAVEYAARMRADMRNTIEQYVGYDEALEGLLDALVDDGMFPVEHLLVENDTLVGALADAQHDAARARAGLVNRWHA